MKTKLNPDPVASIQTNKIEQAEYERVCKELELSKQKVLQLEQFSLSQQTQNSLLLQEKDTLLKNFTLLKAICEIQTKEAIEKVTEMKKLLSATIKDKETLKTMSVYFAERTNYLSDRIAEIVYFSKLTEHEQNSLNREHIKTVSRLYRENSYMRAVILDNNLIEGRCHLTPYIDSSEEQAQEYCGVKEDLRGVYYKEKEEQGKSHRHSNRENIEKGQMRKNGSFYHTKPESKEGKEKKEDLIEEYFSENKTSESNGKEEVVLDITKNSRFAKYSQSKQENNNSANNNGVGLRMESDMLSQSLISPSSGKFSTFNQYKSGSKAHHKKQKTQIFNEEKDSTLYEDLQSYEEALAKKQEQEKKGSKRGSLDQTVSKSTNNTTLSNPSQNIKPGKNNIDNDKNPGETNNCLKRVFLHYKTPRNNDKKKKV
eukprot:CAMPEP_0170525282 /NCGR_PEP_ID=MMETSP0209-20121228/10765_1 /TAXON_ID=665100 ORGANISM="Litonotus pictus, Strain P1" /NCGR_SAMPLE_ID=MMETSP0209 /ASSEMBLY_ACC=CAM_ASM_000301 /LENGTH=426 /DNA_ID=CAMNT_0010814469 /DNA_START=382 /DNA_END=1660 /DNA_ORIENTATION=+